MDASRVAARSLDELAYVEFMSEAVDVAREKIPAGGRSGSRILVGVEPERFRERGGKEVGQVCE